MNFTEFVTDILHTKSIYCGARDPTNEWNWHKEHPETDEQFLDDKKYCRMWESNALHSACRKRAVNSVGGLMCGLRS